MKHDHKLRKRTMQMMIQYAHNMKVELRNVAFGDTISLDQILAKVVAEPVETYLANAEDRLKGVKSGVNNAILIKQVQHVISGLRGQVSQIHDNSESIDEWLYKLLVQGITNIEVDNGKRIEGTGVHWIESGQVLVTGKTHVPNTRLNKCDVFGICDIIKAAVSTKP